MKFLNTMGIQDVVVVGGGVAGLVAAYRLKQMDPLLTVKVLEAKGRVGGRTLTEELDIGNGLKEKFDLGGQWVGYAQEDVMDLIKELSIETYPQHIDGTKFMQLGSDSVRTYKSDIPSLSIRGLIELQYLIWKVEWMAKKVPIQDPYSSPYAEELEGLTVEAFIRKHTSSLEVVEVLDVACKVAFGADARRISALYLLAYGNASGGIMKLFEVKDAAQELRLKGGAMQISEILAERIGKGNVLLNHPVQKIIQNDDEVLVLTENGKTFQSKRVVMAAPPNMINTMKFEPPISGFKKVIYENQPIGHLTKFIVIYRKAFWKDKGYSGEIVSNGGTSSLNGCTTGPISVTFDATSFKGTPAIVGFIAGRASIEWCKKTEKEREEAVMHDLARHFGSEALDYVSYNEKIWAEEPYTGGCPVMFGVPGTMFAFPHLRLPFNRIHFAGTETATKCTGFISGAVQSGKRAATEILYNLKPSLIKPADLYGTCYHDESIPKPLHRAKYNGGFAWYWIISILVVIAVVIFAYIMKTSRIV
ncbi:putative flavin-containing monoamine oxidase A isoform X3 [Oratosquilla oratoria]|uniref:putative flavin-containing monoamine oxidase A isoform X3 n=1 Tax=Oratosquilla oratoria TaxID=337810 RepID=UPI003F76A194